MKRHAVPSIFASALLLAGLAAVGCGHANPPAAKAAGSDTAQGTETAPPLPSDVAPVSGIASGIAKADSPPATPSAAAPASPAAATVEDAGRVAATGELVSPVRSELAMRLPGRVGKVFVDEGARVRKGQPLLTLETEYFELDLARANADVTRAHAATQDAERDLGRKKELIAKNSVSQAAYDRSGSAYDSAKAAEQSTVVARDLARQRLADAVLHSPIDGVVAEKRTDVGQRLGDNSVAFVVAQTSPLKLRFKLPERYLSSVHRGQAVTAAVDPYPGEPFKGRVTLVGGVVDPATRSFNVETEFDNRDGRLYPGLFARVELDIASNKTAAKGGSR
ncbi:MAG: rane fusion protein multidrug efflux system [Acidobacteriota bacterium]|nr:rane fusion protein multidrug efflux system [Acidobacteriota bacterium]